MSILASYQFRKSHRRVNFFFIGILEFNPQFAGQDITPANLEFRSVSTRRRERREKSFSATSAFQGNIQILTSFFIFPVLVNQHPLHSHQSSSFTAVNDELVPLVCKSIDKKSSSSLFLLFLVKSISIY
jgi:hypothetical protein